MIGLFPEFSKRHHREATIRSRKSCESFKLDVFLLSLFNKLNYSCLLLIAKNEQTVPTENICFDSCVIFNWIEISFLPQESKPKIGNRASISLLSVF